MKDRNDRPFKNNSRPGGRPGRSGGPRRDDRGGKPGFKDGKRREDGQKGGKFKGDKPKGDKFRGDKFGDDKPRGDRFKGDKPHRGKFKGDKFKNEKRGDDKPRRDRFKDDKFKSDRPKGDRFKDDKPRGDRPRHDRSRDGKPRYDKPRDMKPREDRPRDDLPYNDKLRNDKPRSDKPYGDKPRDGASKGGKFRNETFRTNRFSRGKPREFQSGQQSRFDGPALKKLGMLLFGLHAVREAWLNPARGFHALYLGENALEAFQPTLDEAREKGLKRPSPISVDKRQLERLCGQDSVHQGIAADAAELPEINLQDIIIRESAKEHSVLLILDHVTDPHNVGAILRSACAFGCGGVIMQSKHAPMLEGVLAKTASGAAEHIPVTYETNLSRSIEALQEAGYIVYGLDERGEQDLNQLSRAGVPHKTALVLGAEGPGLRALVKSHCDALIRLPTSGEIASLNVSNAAAVSLFALTQRV